MRTVLVLAALAGLAAADGLSDYKKEKRRLDKAQRAYWKAFKKQGPAAVQEAWRNLNAWREHTLQDSAQVARAARELNAGLEKIEQERGRAAAALAGSGHPQAAATLLAELIALGPQTAALDDAILKGRPKYLGWHDPRPVFERAGLARRAAALIAALAKAPGAVDLALADGLARAAKADKKESIAARVLVLDLLGACADEKARSKLTALLGDKNPALRIAAIEAALPVATAGLFPVLKDSKPHVRRALLQNLRDRGGHTRWARPLLAHYRAAAGAERAEAVAALAKLSGRAFGDDPEAWSKWFEEQGDALNEGVYQPPPPDAAARTVAPRRSVDFYGLKTPSRSLVFVLDWSIKMTAPAEYEFEKTRTMQQWHTGDRHWLHKGLHESHEQAVTRVLKRTLAELPADASVSLVLLADRLMESYGKLRKDLVVAPGPAAKQAQPFLKRIHRNRPGWAQWTPQFAGLLAIGLLAPEADTVLLTNDGLKRSGRYLLPEHEIAAFARWNRWRRLVVHCVRISDEGVDAKALMEGYARVSGGSYVHALEPPPR